MNNLDYFVDKYKIDLSAEQPIMVPGAGRIEFIELIKDLDFKVGAEIGVQRGEYSKLICEGTPDLKLYCIDAWESYDGYVDFKHREDREDDPQKAFDKFYEQAKLNLTPYNCELIKGSSMNVVKQFEDESLDFVYIDANHDFQNCVNDIAEWSKKVKKGGIIAGHDFWRANSKNITIHVEDAVRGWTMAHGIKPWFVISKDRCPNWMWFKI